MNTIKKQMAEINQLCSESDKIYHNIAQSYHLPESIYWILYILYYCDEPISQVDLCDNWSYSKQTVNSSITAMIKNDWITLEVIPGTRNRKRIVLTAIGKQFCEKIIGRTQDIEQLALSKIPYDELTLFISVFCKINQYMEEEYEEKLHQSALEGVISEKTIPSKD